MATPNQARSGNELGAKTTYQLFSEKESLPVVRGFHIEDINTVELHPWARMGGRGGLTTGPPGRAEVAAN